MELSIIIPAYNNLRHLKNSYTSIRKWYPTVEIILMDDGSDDGTYEWMLERHDEDEYTTAYRSAKRLGHTILYDWGIQRATNDIVGIIHADMIVTENTFENMVKHLERGKVVCATRIEPPLHPQGNEKIIKNFGMDFDSLDVRGFEEFAKRTEKEWEGDTTRGMFAPWILYKEDYEKIGGHDHIFAPFPYEDSDIFQRWLLEGYELVQSRDAFVYHLTCRGHRWNEEIGKNDEEYEKFEADARRNYIRKWGSWIQNDVFQHPIIFPKYDIGFVVHNCSVNGFNLFEQWCSTIYVEDEGVANPLLSEVKDFEKKIIQSKIKDIDSEKTNDIIVEFDEAEFKPEYYNNFIVSINRTIDELTEPNEKFEWEIFTITVGDKIPFGKEEFNPYYKYE